MTGKGGFTGTLTKDFNIYQALQTDSENAYIISSSDDWNTFVSNVSLGENTNGKTFKLMSDISVYSMVGTSINPFKGTFDGNGKTITVNYDSTADHTALFRYIDGAEIKNLTVDGTITTSAGYAGGLVSSVSGNANIHDCVCNVNINSSFEGNARHGGFIAAMESGSTVTMNDCTFGGKLLGENTEGCGGFIGWKEVSQTATLTNCVFATQEVTVSNKGSFTFVRNGYNVYDTCYYTQNIANKQSKKKVSVSQTTENTVTVNGITYYIQPEEEQKGNITYIDKDGSEKTLTPDEYIILDGSERLGDYGIDLDSDKFYVVNSDVNYSTDIRPTTKDISINLLLCDGCTMYVGDDASRKGFGTDLTVFGQSENTGKLEIHGTGVGTLWVYNYIQNGGTVELYNTDTDISCYALNVTLMEMNGGKLTVDGDYCHIH